MEKVLSVTMYTIIEIYNGFFGNDGCGTLFGCSANQPNQIEPFNWTGKIPVFSNNFISITKKRKDYLKATLIIIQK